MEAFTGCRGDASAGTLEFHVKWKNWGVESNTWRPATALKADMPVWYDTLVAAFMERQGQPS